MIRKHLYLFLTEEQDKFLKSLPGNLSEHVRRAIDNYIEKKKKEALNVSVSSSVKEEQ